MVVWAGSCYALVIFWSNSFLTLCAVNIVSHSQLNPDKSYTIFEKCNLSWSQLKAVWLECYGWLVTASNQILALLKKKEHRPVPVITVICDWTVLFLGVRKPICWPEASVLQNTKCLAYHPCYYFMRPSFATINDWHIVVHGPQLSPTCCVTAAGWLPARRRAALVCVHLPKACVHRPVRYAITSTLQSVQSTFE